MTSTKERSSGFVGARRTAELVGREEEMQRIAAVLAANIEHPRVIAIDADGGIGKTRLLQAALMQAQMPAIHVATDLVDLYHAPTHTENGLADAIFQVLKPGEKRFANYWTERRLLARLRLTGEVAGVEEQRQKALKAFDLDMIALAQDRPIVLALDTAECFVYDRELRPESPRQIAQSFAWLCTRLPEWRNVVLLIAGRPASRTLYDRMEGYGLDVKRIKLAPLHGDKCVRYFSAVEAMAREEGDLARADLIARLPNEDRLRAGRLAEGRPVLLALLVDLMTVASVSTINDLLDQVEQSAAGMENRADVRHTLETALIKRLKEATGRLGDTVEMLGRARKGVDKLLAAKLLEISEQEAFLRLGEAKRMSFVKVRPEDERVFLHDEMYDILERALYRAPEDEVAAEEASEVIFNAYDGRIKELQGRLEHFWAPVELEGAGRIDLDALAELTNDRVDLMTEMLYYRLHQAPGRGILRYYRYMHEAILSGDVLLDMQLEAELMAFLGAPNQLEDADARLAHALLVVHPVLRLWAKQDFQATITEATRIRTEEEVVLANASPHASALMDAWLAYAMTYQGEAADMALVEQILRRTIDRLEHWAREQHAGELAATMVTQWFAKAVRAFALRVLGYLEWGRGHMGVAISVSRTSAQLWRELNLRVEMATTLNDMGFAMSEEGKYADARALVEDALEVRRRLGPRSPVALSLNTLALIEVREGNHAKACDLSRRALAIFRALNDERGIGLALIALSEATRRSVDDTSAAQFETRVNLLRTARDHAREAVEIFERLGESIRQAEALLEVGCACRDWVGQIKKRQSLVDPTETLIEESRNALWDAYHIADGVYLRYQLDAMVDLAWLGFYAEQDHIIEEGDKAADALIPAEYRLPAGQQEPVIVDQETEQKTLWPEIGKLFAQRGHRLFRKFEAARHSESGDLLVLLRNATENFWYGLQYSVFYTKDYHNLRREKDRIYRSLKSLNDAELSTVLAAVKDMEERHAYGDANKSALREFLENRALWRG